MAKSSTIMAATSSFRSDKGVEYKKSKLKNGKR